MPTCALGCACAGAAHHHGAKRAAASATRSSGAGRGGGGGGGGGSSSSTTRRIPRLTPREHGCTRWHAQAQGFPDGPKAEAHYYTLIQPYDDFGQPSMPEFYPDAALGVPEVSLSLASFFLPPSHPSCLSRKRTRTERGCRDRLPGWGGGGWRRATRRRDAWSAASCAGIPSDAGKVWRVSRTASSPLTRPGTTRTPPSRPLGAPRSLMPRPSRYSGSSRSEPWMSRNERS